jgi:hypothetical protein
MIEEKADMAVPNANPAAAPALNATDSAPLTPVHCPYHRATDLLQRLAPGKMRVGFFIGAGCPLAVQVSLGNKTEPLIPDVSGLTKHVKKYLDGDHILKAVAQSAWDRVIARGISTPTIEDVLSHIRTLKSLCGNAGIDGFSEDLLGKLDYTICVKVREIVSKDLPASGTPYHVLASWIQAVPRDKPVEIFTTN